MIELVIGIWLAAAFSGLWLAHRRGRPKAGWFLACLVFPPALFWLARKRDIRPETLKAEAQAVRDWVDTVVTRCAACGFYLRKDEPRCPECGAERTPEPVDDTARPNDPKAY